MNPRDLLPRDKTDTDHAEAIVALGYPAVAPVLPELLEWLQDMNWPVALVLAPFLASIGEPLIPEVRRILKTDDEVWKCWILGQVVIEWPKPVADKLEGDLKELVRRVPTNEDMREVANLSQEILMQFDYPSRGDAHV